MNRIQEILLVTSLVLAFCADARAQLKSDANWPAWRGPLANGVAPKASPPAEWAEDKNIRWKVAIPGRGHATPIVWGDRVYIQTAVETQRETAATGKDSEAAGAIAPSPDDDDIVALQPPPDGGRRRRRGGGGFGGGAEPPRHVFQFQVIALDRKTGETIWTRTVREEKPHEAGHGDASQASASPVTDGRHIYSYFGSRGLYCLDMQGNVKWEKDFGDQQTRNQFGEGASPALHGDTLVVVWDHEGDDFIMALDKKTGKKKWRRKRDEPTSWATPLIVDMSEKPAPETHGRKPAGRNPARANTPEAPILESAPPDAPMLESDLPTSPKGATECSHGWSEAQLVDHVPGLRVRPEGAAELLSWAPPKPSKSVKRKRPKSKPVQVIVNNTNFIRSYDLATGKEIWRATGMTDNTVPSPMREGDLVFVISGFRGAAAYAIRAAQAKGDITEGDAIVWKYAQDTPYVPSGVVYNRRLYFLENNRPILTCLDARKGTPVYDKQRLPGLDSIYASMAAAGGKVYIAGRNGTVVVLEDGPEFKLLATNILDEGFDASPAIAGKEIFLRGRSHLYCIAE
ncbi:MAG TPA: PQQ-binding-like beta-propeller repeat protein [Phycisphaerae bacterium]|nr:PQQ-binding-like beta-propeller repeat protein [Phycisphaerae bacterium]